MSEANARDEHLFDEVKRYVGWSALDEARLVRVGPRVAPHVGEIVDDFYDHILAHDDAQRSITGGTAQVERLKATLAHWITGCFTPPYDHTYYERRARIGRRHVEINLPQQYMFTATALIRTHINGIVLRTGGDDVEGELAAVNRLLDLELAVMLHAYREDHIARLQRGERLATFGQLVASIAHELRNPLGVIDSSLFILRRRLGDTHESVGRHLDRIESQVRHCDRIVTSLLDMVRERPSSPLRVAPARLVREAVESVQTRHDTRIDTDIAEAAYALVLNADPDQVVQILVNLCDNAADAVADKKGRVVVSVTVDAERVRFLVNDDGPGLDARVRARLFEPLVTTKVNGIGLGGCRCAVASRSATMVPWSWSPARCPARRSRWSFRSRGRVSRREHGTSARRR